MHLSMHNWMRAEPIETTIARLARLGYESIEISGEPEIYDSKHVKGLLDHYGLRCWGSVTLMLAERNLVARDEAQRAASVKYVKDCITMVKELEGEEMTIVPATVGKITPDGTPEDEWQWAVDGLKEILDHALVEGVRPAIEPLNRFETYFICNANQALTLADAVGPEMGVCLDAFHINIEEADWRESIRKVGPRLVDFHVAENNRMPPGMGDYDWVEVVSILREIGYDGALTMEFVAPIDRTPANPFPNALETDFTDISDEQRKFIEDHGSSTLTEEFYDWLVEKASAHVLPIITG